MRFPFIRPGLFGVACVTGLSISGCAPHNATVPLPVTAPNATHVKPQVAQQGSGAAFVQYSIPVTGKSACPIDIVRATDGSYWFEDPCNGRIELMNNSGVATTALPSLSPYINEVVQAADHNIWTIDDRHFYRINFRTKAITAFTPVSTSLSWARNIAADAAGHVFAEGTVSISPNTTAPGIVSVDVNTGGFASYAVPASIIPRLAENR